MSEKTSVNSGHFHKLNVNEKGNGWAEFYSNPNKTELRHKHAVVSWEIQLNQDECFPDCMKMYSVDGVGPHTHVIPEKGISIDVKDSNPVIRKKKEKVEREEESIG